MLKAKQLILVSQIILKDYCGFAKSKAINFGFKNYFYRSICSFQRNWPIENDFGHWSTPLRLYKLYVSI